MISSQCPLCAANRIANYYTDPGRDYLQCARCHLVFVPQEQFVSASKEKAQYDFHKNDPADSRYREFLGRLATPLLQRLKAGQQGLDFGSGPGPTLSLIFEEAGYPMRIYDYFYARDMSVFDQHYDFITSTETVEHLHQPGRELQHLWQLLKPGGYLGIMTKLVNPAEAFGQWHYKNDPTHVCFFSRDTFEYLAGTWQAKVEFVSDDVIIFTKGAGA